LVHFVIGGPFGPNDFGTFPGLPSDDLQQHEVIYLIVLGFVAAGIAAWLFFCEKTNAGRAFRAIRQDPLPAQNHGRRCRN
jgi:branched-subunit amino acid ABC-type transport system permease component